MPGDETLKVTGVGLTTSDGQPATEVHSDNDFYIKIEYEQKTQIRGLRINLQLVTQLGEIAFMTCDHSSRNGDMGSPGAYRSICQIPGKLLNIGQYTVRLAIDQPGVRAIQNWVEIGSFTVAGHHNGGTTFPDVAWPGVVSPFCSWVIEAISTKRRTEREARALKIN